jgi:hypothetical protein
MILFEINIERTSFLPFSTPPLSPHSNPPSLPSRNTPETYILMLENYLFELYKL